MIVSEIRDIKRKDTRIYYIEKYSAVAKYTILGEEVLGKIDFDVEQNPTGELNVKVEMTDKIDYPILQLKMDLKSYITHLLENNLLPTE